MCRAGMIDPKNRGSFPLDCTTPRPSFPNIKRSSAVSTRCVNVRLRTNVVVVTSRRCKRLTPAVFNVVVPPPLRLLLSSDSREPFSHTISNKQYRPAPEPNWDVRKLFPFTKSRSPLEISAKIIPGNFFALAGFKNNSKKQFCPKFSRDFPKKFFRHTR